MSPRQPFVTVVLNADGSLKFSSQQITERDAARWADEGFAVWLLTPVEARRISSAREKVVNLDVSTVEQRVVAALPKPESLLPDDDDGRDMDTPH